MKDYESDLKSLDEEKKRVASLEGVVEKKEAIQGVISQLEKVEAMLLGKGAKTFKELYPKIEAMPQNPNDEDEEEPETEYSFKFSFRGVKDLTSERENAYIKV